MNVASLELSRELYEVSGWKSDWMYWKRLVDDYNQTKVLRYGAVTTRNGAMVCPAYDLGYLMRKLPQHLDGYHLNMWAYPDEKASGFAFSYYSSKHNVSKYLPQRGSEQPEDAAAKLAIELFKQGVLTR